MTTLLLAESNGMKEMAYQHSYMRYYPDIDPENSEGLRQLLQETKPTTIVIGEHKIDAATLQQWRDLYSETNSDGTYKWPLLLVRRGNGLDKIDLDAAENFGVKVQDTRDVDVAEPRSPSSKVLDESDRSRKSVERNFDLAVTALLIGNIFSRQLPAIQNELASSSLKSVGEKKITIIGSGFVSMITALCFFDCGYQVEVLEKDAKENPTGITKNTFDARQISYSETAPHAAPQKIETWNFNRVKEPNLQESVFTEQFRAIGSNPALLKILQKVVTDMNKESLNGEKGWKYLRQEYPDIFAENVSGSGRVLRIFSNSEELEKAWQFQQSIHEPGLARKVEAQELKKTVPQLEQSIDDGTIFGAVEVVGNAIRSLSICEKIEEHLSNSVRYNQKVEREGDEYSVKDESGEYHELPTDQPFVCSTGVTPLHTSQHNINRVYGMFTEVPNCGLQDPLKIHMPEPVGVISVIPSKDGTKLNISGGLQYFGHREAKPEEMEEVREGLKNYIEKFFPESYAQATANGGIIQERICARPMTASGLPQFSKLQNGGAYIGGTNSGAIVQAPFMAQLALLQVQHSRGEFRENVELNQRVEEALAGIDFLLLEMENSIGRWIATELGGEEKCQIKGSSPPPSLQNPSSITSRQLLEKDLKRQYT